VAVPNSLRVRKCKRRAMGRGHTERLAVIKQEERDEWEDGQPDTDKKDDAAFDCTGCQVDNDRALAGRTERITAAGASHRSALMVHVLLSHSMQSAATRGLSAVASEIRQSAAGQRQHLCPLSPMMTLAGESAPPALTRVHEPTSSPCHARCISSSDVRWPPSRRTTLQEAPCTGSTRGQCCPPTSDRTARSGEIGDSKKQQCNERSNKNWDAHRRRT
jgi:hypothetical protein